MQSSVKNKAAITPAAPPMKHHVQPSPAVVAEHIAIATYLNTEARGFFTSGYELDDWLAAEREVH